MVVCVEPALGFFFRINTNPYYQTPIALSVANNGFLEHDSFLECGTPMELDDYVIAESIRENQGTLGVLSAEVVPQIIDAVRAEKLLSPADRHAVIVALESLLPT